MIYRILLLSAVPIAVGFAILFVSNSAFLSTMPVVKLDPSVTYDYIIPPVNYTAIGIEEAGLQHTPSTASDKCLFYFSHWRNETAGSYGVYVAQWLALRGHQFGADYVYFTYDFPWPTYNLKAGWKSGLAQGLAAECFLEAYSYTGNSTFLDFAKRSLMFLSIPIEQGGVMIDESNNNGSKRWWYEEYPSEGGSFSLSGHQFVLIALSKYLEIDPDNQYIRELRDNGLRALKASALQYDNGKNDSYYDRLKRIPANQYHTTHIINFQRLYDITGDEEWLRIKKVFEE
jgi:D-glucuronyl C5-epimerase-like protein